MPATDCISIHSGALTRGGPLQPCCEVSGGASAAVNQGGKAVHVICDHKQCTITITGWGCRAECRTSSCCSAPRISAGSAGAIHLVWPDSCVLAVLRLPQHGCPSSHCCLLRQGLAAEESAYHPARAVQATSSAQRMESCLWAARPGVTCMLASRKKGQAGRTHNVPIPDIHTSTSSCKGVKEEKL